MEVHCNPHPASSEGSMIESELQLGVRSFYIASKLVREVNHNLSLPK